MHPEYMQKIWDVIIIGGGAAGLSAALMLGRARRNTLVVDAGQPRNRFADHMHGVLGHDGLPPQELLSRGRAEAAAYGVEFLDAAVESVSDGADHLRIITSAGEEQARALIVATGIADVLPSIPGLQERWGKTVLHCPYCHGWEVRDQRLGVLVTSPMGMHQAELIRQWSDRLTIFSGGFLTTEQKERLRSRDVVIVDGAVDAIIGNAPEISAVRLQNGEEVPIDAIFVMGAAHPHDGFLAELSLDRAETPLGPALAVDATGRTSHGRIWAVGNVTNFAASVPVAMSAGSMAGAVVNANLVGWDYDAAAADPWNSAGKDPAEFWEEQYSSAERRWSGKVNAVLADVASTLTPGRALDLGSGEGGDVLWLAEHGWDATGIEISPTAVARAQAAAEGTGASFIVADLAELSELPHEEFDLVSVSFLHSPVALARESILREATTRVAQGGHLLITSHAAVPPWSPHAHSELRFPTPAEELAHLELDPDQWDVVVAESRERIAKDAEGNPAPLDDVVVLVRRR